MATKKRPTKFRQGRRQGKVDAKKVFQGAAKAGLKDKDRFTKFSADDIEALNEVKKEAKKGYITDDKGNKISVKPTETSLERIARDRAAAKAEALRMFPYDEAELKAMSKSDRAAAEAAQKRISEPKASSSGKPEGRTASSAQKVRSGVTVNEPKSQGYKVDKDGNKIKEPKPKGFKTVKTAGAAKKAAVTESKKIAKVEKKTLPVSKKGFAAGKQLNAEGKALFDKFRKEGDSPQRALNRALFRQEKGAKTAAKAAGPIATAAKSAASKVKKQGPVKSKVPAGAKPIGVGTMKDGKLTFKFNDKEIKSIAEKNRAAKATKVPSTVVSSKPNIQGKELAVRPKPGAIVAKTAAKKAGAKAAFTTAALGAAKSTGRLFTSKAGLAITAATLLGKPVLQALTKDPQAGKKQSTTTTGIKKETPKLKAAGKFVGVGAGGSTYKVNAGDTLSGIAKKSGVTLSELMAANKKIKDPRKIYRNTSVNIPSKGKVPTGGYAGPVPYRPKKK
jgi:LysM repeat protein